MAECRCIAKISELQRRVEALEDLAHEGYAQFNCQPNYCS